MRDRQKRDSMIEAFRRADKNGDGRLSVDEIYAIYIEHGIEVTFIIHRKVGIWTANIWKAEIF